MSIDQKTFFFASARNCDEVIHPLINRLPPQLTLQTVSIFDKSFRNTFSN